MPHADMSSETGARPAAAFCRLAGAELRRALRNPWFVLPVLACCALVIVNAVQDGLLYEGQRDMTLRFGDPTRPNAGIGNHFKSYGITSSVAWKFWIGTDSTPEARLLFMLMPLSVLLSHATSWRADAQSGYLEQLYVRAPRRICYEAKALAVFVSAGLVAAIPLLVSLVASLCAAPAHLPLVKDLLALESMVWPYTPFASLFYHAPLAFVAMWTLIDFVLAGTWATAVLALSLVVQSRVLLVAGAYLLQFALQYAGENLGVLVGLPSRPAGLMMLMRPVGDGIQPLPAEIFATWVACAVTSVVLPALLVRRDVL